MLEIWTNNLQSNGQKKTSRLLEVIPNVLRLVDSRLEVEAFLHR